MNSCPSISVIVPCYNQASFLPAAVLSVINQSCSNWECIIINDGSTDDTELVARECVKKDSRITLHNKRNGGLSSARNYGINVAKGEYLLFLDSDDIIYPDYLE